MAGALEAGALEAASRAAGCPRGGGAFSEFLAERSFNLRAVILQFGFDPGSLETPILIAEEDPAIAAESVSACDAPGFALAELGGEFERRAPSWGGAPDPATTRALKAWRRQLVAYVACAVAHVRSHL